MEVTEDGKVTRMESVVTDEGDWVFGADAHLAQTRVENWGEIPAGRRDTRAAIQAAADAYLDNWGDPDLPVPHGKQCSRLEGRIFTGTQALANGLVDSIGGLDAAIREAARMAGIPAERSVAVEPYIGRQGRGWTGGGRTNWNSRVVPPSTTLPRELSLSLIWKWLPALRAEPLWRIWSRSCTPPGSPTRPDILSVKFRM